MARDFTSGAEENDVLAVWDNVDLVGNSGGTRPAIYSRREDDYNFMPRTGHGMYLLDAAMYLRRDYGSDTSKTELYWGLALRAPALGTSEFFVAYTDDAGVYSNRVALALTSDGKINVLRSGTSIVTSNPNVISANQWYYIEVWIKPLDSNGRVMVKVDGVTVIDYTGDTTAEEQFINAWQISGVENLQTTRPATAFDDIVCNDTTGTTNNGWPGMVRLLPIRPHADGHYSQWSRAALDLGSQAAQVRNGAWGLTLLQTSDADKLSTFATEVPDLPAGASITNVIITARARVESGAGVIAPMVRSNGTDSISTDRTLLSNWRNYQYCWAVNPADSAAWEESDLATLEIGVSS